MANNLEIKLNTHYLAKTNKISNKINIGDSIFITKYYSTFDEKYSYTIFLPINENSKTFFGMEPKNRTEVLSSFDEVLYYLDGVELEYDTKLVDSIIDGYLEKINKIKRLHNYE